MSASKFLEIVPKTNPIAPICFAAAGFAFLASLIGAIVNHWLSGWMAVGGMAGVGLFYLALGLLNLGLRIPVLGSPLPAGEDLDHEVAKAAHTDETLIKVSRVSPPPSTHRTRNPISQPTAK